MCTKSYKQQRRVPIFRVLVVREVNNNVEREKAEKGYFMVAAGRAPRIIAGMVGQGRGGGGELLENVIEMHTHTDTRI